MSTVDSGNLAGALIALAQGLLELDATPQTHDQRLDGLADTADLLAAGIVVERATLRQRAIVTEINRLGTRRSRRGAHRRRPTDAMRRG